MPTLPARLFAAAFLVWLLFLPPLAAAARPAAPPSPDSFECPVAPTGRDFSGQSLREHDFHAEPPGSLVGAKFDNADLRGAVFAGQNLAGASFRGANLGPTAAGSASFTSAKLTKTCFVGAELNGTDFTYATLQCADFSGTSLMKARFGPLQNIVPGDGCRTLFVSSTLDVHAISLSNWGKVDFSYADFQDLSPRTFSLRGKDITGAILVGTDFPGIDMRGANLTRVDFSEANLLRVPFDDAAMNGIRMVGADASYATLTCARFYGTNAPGDENPNAARCTGTPASTDTTGGADLSRANFQHADFTRATLNHAVLHGTNLAGSILQNASFIRARLAPGEDGSPAASLVGADLGGSYFSYADLNSVNFGDTELIRANFDDTTLQGTVFAGAVMPGASFDGATLESVSFRSAVLENASFQNTILKTTPEGRGTGVDFTCARLGGADFADATVSAADFQAAVMPQADSCCPPKGGFVWCGNVDATQSVYEPTTTPVLTTEVNCPDGEVAACRGRQWEIPGWQTNLCGGETRTVWTRPPCDAPPGDVVHFADLRLEQCILDSLPGDPSEVTVATARTILSVSCPGKDIENLGGLESFTSLQSLDLTSNAVSSFAFDFPSLVSLKLSDNGLASLDVGGLPGLVLLEAADNELARVGLLGRSGDLEVLDLANNRIADLDLAYLESLIFVDLSSNRLTSVLDEDNPSLGRLRDLSYLDLSGNDLPTLGSASSIAFNPFTHPSGALEHLFLSCNPRFRCQSLGLDGSFPALRWSHCADLDASTGRWVMRAHPSCPTDPDQTTEGDAP